MSPYKTFLGAIDIENVKQQETKKRRVWVDPYQSQTVLSFIMFASLLMMPFACAHINEIMASDSAQKLSSFLFVRLKNPHWVTLIFFSMQFYSLPASIFTPNLSASQWKGVESSLRKPIVSWEISKRFFFLII